MAVAAERTTQVSDVRSDPGTVQRKAGELAALRPGGLPGALAVAALSPFIWISTAAMRLPLLLKATAPPPALPPRTPVPFPVHEEWVVVNGVSLHCVSPRPRDTKKPLMLLMHGFPELWYSWRWQMAEFADDYDGEH